jgi:two-component system chemotaxis response regulator CheY
MQGEQAVTGTNTLPAEDKKKILVVDDSTAMRFALQDILTRHGYLALAAVDGIAALEILAKEPNVVLVLADLHMPRLDGIGLLRNLRRESKTAALPVIIQTSEARSSLMTTARQAGATGWLVKPYDEATLVRGIQRLLRER